MRHDADWLVIGSGFGGAVSALRLAEKGNEVLVLESGRRFADHELPRSTWDLRRYFFMPRLGLKGILRLSVFKDIASAAAASATPTPSTAPRSASMTTRSGPP
jgi:cholesterol oxidase